MSVFEAIFNAGGASGVDRRHALTFDIYTFVFRSRFAWIVICIRSATIETFFLPIGISLSQNVASAGSTRQKSVRTGDF